MLFPNKAIASFLTHLFPALLALAIGSPWPGIAAPGVVITSPANNTTLQGTVRLSAQSIGTPESASVEFLLNGRSLGPGRIAAQPFELEWNSSSVWDGDMELEAIARDDTGRVIAASAPVRFRVANGSAQASHLQPVPPGPASGRIDWTIQIRTGDPIEAVMFFVDGEQVGIVWGDRERATLSLDTTRFANGAHELFTGVYSLVAPKRPVAMTQVRVTFDNGRTVRAVLPRYRELFLAPGQSVALSPSLLYTNGDRAPAAAVSYQSDNPSIASVSSDGVVRAVASGVTTIIVEAEQHRARVAVVAGGPLAAPHFSRDGHPLENYDPGQSLFVRTLFNLDPVELDRKPGLTARLEAAGVNVLTSGFWALPQDLDNPASYDQWLPRWETYWGRIEDAARNYGFSLLLTGDNMARGPRELHTALSAEWGLPGIQHAFSRLRDSGRVVGVEMVDEVSGMWGNTPTPTDGRWLNRQPPIPDNAFVRLMSAIGSVSGHSPVTWPVLWLSPPEAVRNWMGDAAFSDYTSMYWDNLAWRRAYPWGMSLPQIRESLEHVTVNRRHLIQRDRPLLLEMSVTGPYYTKLGPGTEYSPGQDWLQAAGTTPEAVASQALYAMAVGAAGVRVYGFDSDHWKHRRSVSQAGSRNLQTGIDPFETGTDRWQAMAAAFQLVHAVEPYLFQPRLPSPELGPEFVTAARRGARSSLLMAVNMTEAPAVARPDLTPYQVPGATSMIRYRLHGPHLIAETLPLAATDQLTLMPGEGALWLIVPSDEPRILTPSVSFATGLPGVASGTVPVIASVTGPRAPDRVELVIDGRAVASRTSSPYQFGWNTAEVQPGVWHGVTIRAYGPDGFSAAHAAVLTVMASASQNTPPVVSLTKPSPGANFMAPASLALAVDAFDADGRVEKVEFLAGSQVIGVATVAPYEITWPNVAPGSYSLSARVTDNEGAVAVSAPVTITVKLPSQPPSVSISAPVTGDVFVAPATITIRASSSDSDGAVTKVEFLADQTLLGIGAAPAFELVWNNVPAGSYLLTAKATDDAGATATSAPVSVIVSAPEPSPPSGSTPAFYQGVNLGGPALTMEGNAWLSQAAAQRAGLILNTTASFAANYSFPVIPPPDPGTLKMLSSAVWKPGTVAGQSLSLVHPLPNGDYYVYVYVIENYRDEYRVLDLRLEGVTAATGVGKLPLGNWKRYGPYPVSVNDGKLNIEVVNAGRGDPALTGYAIYSAGGGLPPTPPASEAAFYQAINLGGEAVMIDNHAWLSHPAALDSGLSLHTASTFSVTYGFSLTPAPDFATSTMLSSGGWKPGTSTGEGLRLARPIPNGEYQVYLYLVENYRDNYRAMSLWLEGALVTEKIGELPLGHWARYGPYPVAVTDGVLNIDIMNAGKGDPLLNGLAIYRVSPPK